MYGLSQLYKFSIATFDCLILNIQIYLFFLLFPKFGLNETVRVHISKLQKLLRYFILIQILGSKNEANKKFVEIKCIRAKLKPISCNYYLSPVVNAVHI